METFALGVLTVCKSAGEVEGLNVASPLYCAVMECVPDDKADVVMLAEPPTSGRSPETGVLPSKNITVPMAALGVTLAVKVRESPTREGFVPAVNVTAMPAFSFTTFWVKAALVEAVSRLLPV